MNAFSTFAIPPEINNTYLTLIPNTPHPEYVTKYRPIGLCNTIYKIITKIIVHRIHPLLSKIINLTQSSFIPGRCAADNAILVQEVIHSFKYQKGKTGNMLLKIDLEKAFDRLEWSFLHFFLHQLNFPPPLIKLIMSCVTTSFISILIYGKPSPYFQPTRGTR